MQALVPLFDSLSPAFAGPCFIRISAILAGLVKLHNIIDCKAMPSQCRSMLKNFVWEMGSGVSKQNATTIGGRPLITLWHGSSTTPKTMFCVAHNNNYC